MASVTLAASASMLVTMNPSVASAAARAGDASTLRIGQQTAFDTNFLPGLAESLYTQEITGAAFDSLLTVDKSMKFHPWLAKSWAWSKDKKTLTMTLAKAKWSDGKPITSDDVLEFINFLGSKAYSTTLQGSYQYLVAPLEGSDQVMNGKATSFADTGGFKKLSDTKFELHFTTVDAAVLYADIASYQPLPYHILKNVPFAKFGSSSYNHLPTVTDGPYTFKSVQGTDSVTMAANPNYWAGAPKIQNVIFQTVSPNVAPGLLSSGQLDIMMNGIKPTDYQKLAAMPGMQVYKVPSLGFQYMGAKLNNLPELQDVRVRQAFMYALDRKAYIKGILKGLGIPINSPLPNVSWAAATGKDGLNPYNYDVAKANALLDAAGWTKQKNGWRIDPKTGKTADLHLVWGQGNPTRQALAVAIQQNLAKVGVKITLSTPIDFNTLIKKIENDDKSVQLWLAGWGLATDPDPRGLWDSTDPYNFERYVNKKNDALIAETWGAKAFNVAYRKKAFIKWELYMNQQLPLWFLYQNIDVIPTSSRVHIPASDIGPGYLNDLGNLQDWTLSN